jgi:hypothetical protein
MNLGSGTFSFEEAEMILDSEYCALPQGIGPCVGKYAVYVTADESGPTSLRLEVVVDPWTDRRNSLNRKTLLPAEPE